MKTHLAAALLCAPMLCALPLVAGAADIRLRPGQWKITTESDMGGVKTQMPKLTPEQIKQMEKAGVKMPQTAPGGGFIVKTCLTKEQVERNEMPKPKDNERMKCEQTEMSRSGNTFKWKMVCTGEHPMTGSGTMTMSSPEAYTTSSTFTSKDSKRGEMTVNSKSSGKWVADACEQPAGKAKR